MQNQALLICLLIASCSGDPGIQTSTKTPLDEVIYTLDPNLLGTPSCKPPCWNDIMPGTTIVGEAIQILEQMEALGKGELVSVSEIFIVWHDSLGKSRLIRVLDETIVRIELLVTNDMNVGLLTDQFGPPTAIEIEYPQHGGPKTLVLYYPTDGMIVYSFGLEESDSENIGELPADLVVYKATYVKSSGSISSMITIISDTYRGQKGVWLPPQIIEWE